MKRIALFLPLVFIIITSLKAQIHDFDSLYDNDISFKQSFKSGDQSKSIFNNDEIMNITIESDFKNLVKSKNEDEYQPAVFRYFLNDSIVVTRNIKIKPRGNMRKASCFFPPLKLNFDKKEMVIKEMKEFDKMKMVLDCKRGKSFEQYLLSEFLVYKMHNILTEFSFRVRLLKVTYIDTSEKYKTSVQHAFLIEDKEQVAKRLNAIPIDNENISDHNTNIPTVANVYLFQYLIGNTDWSIPGRHNIQLIKSNDPTNLFPYVIPYDFDFAGIVNASYAIPHETLGIESVRERVYRGTCIPEVDLKNASTDFSNKKELIYSLYQNSGLLDDRNKKSTIIYIDEYYSILDDESKFKRNILDQCRQ